ncbi:phenylalanine--tRNA ligase beta subunit-related protein [Irregularibacter muris]|uniref:Phenylalanine--tRNA ligase beta subunit-related protein n=1 Tax=Irregularibacter muris TaxID=1796619 RepID=A0AAE3KYU3_9FIRM|nr:phenylalanine--tRNA ligase beta subunit-related protein [Irregularibacter muris]MCR1897571.1 phenylalanine--tRNA ligase beta subunit-related protein [Irregularibacter muris]
MVEINISSEVKELCPNTVLGCIETKVKVQKASKELWEEIHDYCKKMKEHMVVGDISKQQNIKDTRQAYRKLGKDPTRYRSSAEALARRILKGQDLYSINNVVEINNLISLQSLYPVCAYDLEKVTGAITLERAGEGATYEGIGKGKFNIEFLPTFADRDGYFGSTTSDSERTMVNDHTQNLLMIIVSFNGEKELIKHVENMERLLKTYADAKDVERKIIK